MMKDRITETFVISPDVPDGMWRDTYLMYRGNRTVSHIKRLTVEIEYNPDDVDMVTGEFISDAKREMVSRI